MEIRPIPGVDGYGADSLGNIYHIKLNKKRKLCCNIHGYPHFTYWVEGKCKTLHVHQAVALAFIERIPGKDEVNHKNGNKLDNRVENLEWVSRTENVQHARDMFQCYVGENNGRAKLSANDIRSIRSATGTHKEIAKRFGISPAHVTRIINRKAWAHVE